MQNQEGFITQIRRFPSSTPFIVGNEAAERFSFYGMKALLTTFLIQQFAYSEASANEVTHLFITGAYFFSFLGGMLADWFLGKYKTILYLSLIYCVGHACLAVFDMNPSGFLFGIFLIALGAGGIKPCVSANVGDQFTEDNKDLIPKLYDIFYFSINVGATVSMLVTPWLMKAFGPAIAFGVPGILMGLASLIFFAGRKKYVMLPPTGFPKATFLGINYYAIRNLGKVPEAKSWLDNALGKYTSEQVDNTKAVWKIIGVFAFIPLFWALYDQNGSEWVIQATKMNTDFMGMSWLPEQIQSINGILILLFIPLFSAVIYPALEKLGIRITPLRKIGTGFILTAVSFAIISWIQLMIDEGQKPVIAWQILAYTILTAAEVMVSITGLEYAYTRAPAAMKSTIMAIWFLTVAIGNYLVTLINGNIASGGFLAGLEGASYFLFFTGLMTATSLIFIWMSTRMKEQVAA
jgi:POT family proton-dependent oligopeptide transporter